MKHRYSQDLDLFSEKKFSHETVYSYLLDWAKEYDFTFELQSKEVVDIFFLKFKDQTALKIKFRDGPQTSRR